MKDFTIVVQGAIKKDCAEANIRNALNIPVILSTWIGEEYDGSDAPKKVIMSEIPDPRGIQNFMLQLVSTIEGIKNADTKYVIKVRGDEYYNYNPVVEAIMEDDSKIYTCPVFFRPFKSWAYHISDHMIAGRTDYMLNMFVNAKERFEKHGMSHDDCKEWGLTKSHMRNMGFDRFEEHSKGKNKMKSMFGIISMEELKPYKVTCNSCGNRTFVNDFVPGQWNSIDKMEQL